MSEYIIENMLASYQAQRPLPDDMVYLAHLYLNGLTDEARAVVNRWYKNDRNDDPKGRGVLSSFEIAMKIFLFKTLGMFKKEEW